MILKISKNIISYVGILCWLTFPNFADKTKVPAISVNIERLKQDVQVLTSITPHRNYRNAESLNLAAEHIHNQFSKVNQEVIYQEYRVEDKIYKNVIF